MSSILRTTFRAIPSSSTILTKHVPPRIFVTAYPRHFNTSSIRPARYERFPVGPVGQPNPQGQGPSGPGRPTIVTFLRRRFGSDRALWLYGIGIGGGGIYYVTHLERVPETGRLRFIDVNVEQEIALGQQSQLQTLSEYSQSLLPPNHPTTKRVRAIASRIIEGSNLGHVKSGDIGSVEANIPGWKNGEGEISPGDLFFGGGAESGNEVKEGKETEWEVYVIDDKGTKNAFVLPGGKIFVFTGILPVSANDDGLATVLGHEVAHQVARHPAERMSSLKVVFALNFLLESLGLDVGLSRLLLTFLLQLPNSRKSESEADYIGLQLMSKACFDPQESTKMWTRMSQSEDGSEKGIGSVDFLSTHPANAKRIKQLEKWMPEALQVRASSPCGATASQYGGFLDSLSTANGGMGRTMWG